MKKKSIISIIGTIAAAFISGVILYETLIAGNLLRENGLLGIFLAAMLSHLTIIGRGIFLPTFLLLANVYHPLLMGLSAGLGGAKSEVTSYYWGLGMKEAVSNNEKENILTKWFRKNGILALLIVAVSPLPDTPLMLLAGTARLPILKIMTVQVIGKTILYSLEATVGGFIFVQLSSIFEELLISSIIIIVSVIFCVIVFWRKNRGKTLKLLRGILH
jgi:membrane protein YqaA with SNARE-associated domain